MHTNNPLASISVETDVALPVAMPQGRPRPMPNVPPRPRTVLFPLAVSPPWTDPNLPTGTPCLACGESLVLHQPDIKAPERLLGTCDDCGAWHLIDADRGVTVLLPDADGLRDAEDNG